MIDYESWNVDMRLRSDQVNFVIDMLCKDVTPLCVIYYVMSK